MAPRLKNTPKIDQAPAGIGDNSAAVEEASRIQLISIVAKLSTADEKIEEAKGPLQAAQKHRKTIIGLGKAAGFSAKELEARLAEMRRPTFEMLEQAAREKQHRGWLGIIPEGDQAELLLGEKVPQEDKDEAHFAAEGYKAGLRQMPSNPPTEVPARFVQSFMKGHEKGLMEVLSANAPKQMGVREQAAADFAKDNPEPGTPEAAKLEREAIRRAKESLAAMPSVDPDAEAVQAAARQLAEENPAFPPEGEPVL